MKDIVTPNGDWSYRFECACCGTTATADRSDLLLARELTSNSLHMICPHCDERHYLDLNRVPREIQRLVRESERERFHAELRREQDERAGFTGWAGGRLVDDGDRNGISDPDHVCKGRCLHI
jgi:hypothetical protein